MAYSFDDFQLFDDSKEEVKDVPPSKDYYILIKDAPNRIIKKLFREQERVFILVYNLFGKEIERINTSPNKAESRLEQTINYYKKSKCIIADERINKNIRKVRIQEE